MRQRLTSIIFLCIFVVVVTLLIGCNTVGGGGPPYSDDFNRADTSGLDLGSSDWNIYEVGSTTSTMTISINEVESHFKDGTLGLVAAYSGNVDYANAIRVSVKFKVVSSNEVPFTDAGLFLNLQTASNFASYYLQVNRDTITLSEFDGSTVVDSELTTYSIANDTWYILELDSNGDTMTGRLKTTGGTVLASVSYVDTPRTYSDGNVGFYNFTTTNGTNPVDQPVFFDDFSVTNL